MANAKNSNIVHIVDPLYKKDQEIFISDPSKAKQVPGKVPLGTLPADLATSYTTQNDAHYSQSGRDGYSVKLIPLSFALKAGHGDMKGDKAEIQEMKH